MIVDVRNPINHSEFLQMHSLKKSKPSQFTAEIIKDIVLDVEKYPEFLPWCKYVNVLSKEVKIFTAEMVVAFKGFQEKYVSEVECKVNKDGYVINVKAVSGLFKYLKNVWWIKREPLLQAEQYNLGYNSMNPEIITNHTGSHNDVMLSQAQVEFQIDFECKSMILDKIVGIFFEAATSKMIDAFEKRAHYLSIHNNS